MRTSDVELLGGQRKRNILRSRISFAGYLTTLSVSRPYSVDGRMIDEWNRSDRSLIEVISLHMPRRTEENMKYFSQIETNAFFFYLD
jgi:hypothetical protein